MTTQFPFFRADGAFALLALVLATPTLPAAMVYSFGHGDLGVGYEDGELHPHWHMGDGAVVDGVALPDSGGEGYEFEADELIAQVATTRSSAAGSLSYLGVSPGSNVYVAGLSSHQPYLGFGAEELDPGDWLGNISVALTGWSMPAGGNFALYTTNLAGTTTSDVFLSTFDPSQANVDGLGANIFGLAPGSHDHFQFGFTAPGEYTLTLEYSGNHAVDGAVTGSGTFTFQVVPEPGVGGLLVGSAVLAGLVRRRRRA